MKKQQNHSFAAKIISQNNGHIQILRQQNQTVVHLVLTRSAEEKKQQQKKQQQLSTEPVPEQDGSNPESTINEIPTTFRN